MNQRFLILPWVHSIRIFVNAAKPNDNRREKSPLHLDAAALSTMCQAARRDQAAAGAKTREILMTTLLTLKKRQPGDVWLNLKACLDEMARDPSQDPYQLLFSPNTS